MDYIKIKRFVVFCYDSSVDYDNCKTNIKYQQEKSKPSWGPTCPGDLPLPPAGPTNLPTPGGWSLAAIWVTTYFLQSWGQLLKGRLLWRNLRLLQPRREPTLGRVWGLFPQPSTAWSPRRSPRPAGWQSWWPPRWGRSCWQGCQDRSGIFLLRWPRAIFPESPDDYHVWPVRLCWTSAAVTWPNIPTLGNKKGNVLNTNVPENIPWWNCVSDTKQCNLRPPLRPHLILCVPSEFHSFELKSYVEFASKIDASCFWLCLIGSND